MFVCDVPAPSPDAGYEEIDGFMVVSPVELEELIVSGQIDDGFTLSSFALLQCKMDI